MRITIGNKSTTKNVLKKALSDDPSLDLKPLYNSNVTKVSVVKLSQIKISTVRSPIFSIPTIFNISLFLCI